MRLTQLHGKRSLAWAVFSLLLAAGEPSQSADPVFDARGFQPNREFFSELPFEHIDPMTGNVLLTFTDLMLPGNAGFDLRIQRTYNSKIYDIYSNTGGSTLEEDSWAGIGWRLHMGRVLNPTDVSPGPIIEMPDGSRHQLYLHMDGNTNHYITKDYWTYDNVFQFPVLRLPNGLKYTFGHSQGVAFYTTKIEDPFGNKVVVTYAPPPAPEDVIASITQELVGGQTRTVTFSYNATLPGPGGQQAAGSLATMAFKQSTWTYSQQLTNVFTYTQLTQVKPPIGPSWMFEYEDTDPLTPFMLNHLKTPNGGVIDYTYEPQIFYIGSSVLYSPAVTQRQVSGRAVPTGTWSYVYSSSTDKNETVITSPSACSIKTTYTFLGIGPNANQNAWAIGALDSRVTATTGGSVFETEDLTWIASVPISNVPESGSSPQTHVALLGQRNVTRSGRTYSTEYTYSGLPYNFSRPNNFNDFGRAHTVDEDGDSSRTTTRTFFYGSSNDPSFGTYIVDKVKTETLQAGSESFSKSYTYTASNGFKTSETIYGITTTYTPHSSGSGNVGSAKDANNNSTTYSYSWGVPSLIQTPKYTITRIINNDSTISSETRRGFTTSFLYDLLSRPTRSTPPVGNAMVTTYDNTNGATVTVTRGASTLNTFVDGFARPTGTQNGVGIKTALTYDACGRTIFASYPFVGSPTGTNYTYDQLGRIKTRTHPGGAFVSYAYSQGVDVTITDEEQRSTQQNWSAFGDPADARLAAVTDADVKTTQYTFNALGSLTSASLPGGSGPARSWTYNSKNQLVTEVHPENGQTTYTYDPAGNLKTRTDAQFGTTTFSYDGNNRVIGVDRPGGGHDAAIGYDASDNRTELTTSDVSSVFEYDAANRLVSRTDDLDGVALKPTTYQYDSNDNLDILTYPSGAKVDYTYDSENRITRVARLSGPTYADQFTYHPSGALAEYRAGNGLRHTLTYDARYRLQSVNAGGSLRLTYAYYNASNVKSIQDARAGFSATFTYDAVDRLRTVTGTMGNPAFTYSAPGNRLTKNVAGATTSYTYDDASQLLLSASGAEPASFTYDLNGNLTGDGIGSYAYAPTNMMVGAAVGGSSTGYLYDGDDLRKAKLGSNGISYFVHGLGGQLLGEYKATAGPPQVVREYVMAGTRLIAEVSPTVIAVAPASLKFLAVLDQGPPAPKSLALSTDGGNISWTATKSDPWLTVSPASGSTPATLTVSVNASNLAPGSYSGSVTITAPSAVNSPVVVPVQLTVFATASLFVTPSAVSFFQPAGGPAPQPKAVEILFPGNPVEWQATSSHPWISVSPTQGSTPAVLTVSVSGQSLPPGTHNGTVTIKSVGTPGSPQTLAVELVVGAAAGMSCAAGASYCEIFDDEPLGDLDAGWVWSEPNAPQVVADPRAVGQAMLLDPPPVARLNGDVALASPHAISGTEISVQVMTTGTNPGIPWSLAKIEFYTEEGEAWGKTTRTFGTIRFGSNLRFQYGRTAYAMLVNPMQPGRWYAVKVRYVNGQTEVYVDGALKFTTPAPDPALQMQAFSLTAWDFAPGAAYADLLEVRPPELVVDPMNLEFRASRGGGGGAGSEPPDPLDRPSVPAAPRTNGASGPKQAAQTISHMQLPAAFEANVGQADDSVKFVAHASDHLLLARSNDIILALPEGSRPSASDHRDRDRRLVRGSIASPATPRRMALVGMKLGLADRPFEFKAENPLPGVSHYFIGDDPARWRTHLRRYSRLVAKEIYPGIDLVLRDQEGRVEYDLLVAPGADPAAIEIEFEGTRDIRLDRNGDLEIEADLGRRFRQSRPSIYQIVGKQRRDVSGRFALRGKSKVGFVVDSYDTSVPLVIDPVIVWSSSLGGSVQDGIEALAVDAIGATYVTGYTVSTDFPLSGPFQSVKDEFQDAFVSKLLPDGSGLVYSSYLGGSGTYDVGRAIQVDALGRAVVAGVIDIRRSNPVQTGTFPIVNATPIGPQGLEDVFLAQVSADGSSLVYSTRIGGSSSDLLFDASLDALGRVHVVGYTASADFPLQNPFQSARAGDIDGFVLATLDSPGGPRLVYSSYLGGNQQGSFTTYASAVAADAAGNAYVAGWTTAADFPQAIGCTPGGHGQADGFVAKLSVQGSFTGIRCFGGSLSEVTRSVAVGPSGEIYIVGYTNSQDFPTVNPLFTFGGASDTFIVALTNDLLQLTLSTPFGGLNYDSGEDVAVDSLGQLVVTGFTNSGDLPIESPLQGCPSFPQDDLGESFLLKLEPGGTGVVYSTYLPGGGPGGGIWAEGIAIGVDDSIFVAGETWTSGTPPDGFITKVVDGDTPQTPGSIAIVTTYGDTATEGVEGSVTFFIQRLNGSLGTVGVDFETTDQTARAGADYEAVFGTASLAENQCLVQQAVPIFDDLLAEANETFEVSLSNPTGGAILDPRSSVVFTIIDNEEGEPNPPLQDTFTISHRSQPVGPTWQASDDASWLTLDTTSGTGPSTVTVFANPTGLAEGTHVGRITVTATDATGSPQVVEVTLIVSSGREE